MGLPGPDHRFGTDFAPDLASDLPLVFAGLATVLARDGTGLCESSATLSASSQPDAQQSFSKEISLKSSKRGTKQSYSETLMPSQPIVQGLCLTICLTI
jgi:hypothetical protein